MFLKKLAWLPLRFLRAVWLLPKRLVRLFWHFANGVNTLLRRPKPRIIGWWADLPFLLADVFGQPVSTTHVLSSGVAGASVANRFTNSGKDAITVPSTASGSERSTGSGRSTARRST